MFYESGKDRLGLNLPVRLLLEIKFSLAAFRNYGWRFWTGITSWFRVELMAFLQWNSHLLSLKFS